MYRFLILLVIILSPSPALAYNPPPATSLLLFNREIRISLPPRLIMTPASLRFPRAGVEYSFNIGTGQFERDQRHLKHRIVTTLRGSGDGEYYEISIRGFKIDEEPNLKDFRLTFAQPVPRVNIDTVEEYLKSNQIPTARLTGPGCAGNTNSHICLETITRVRVLTRSLPEARLRQTIPVRGVFVEGNVAAPSGQLANFAIDPNAIALGGEVVNVRGRAISGYQISEDSTINWGTISQTLDDLFELRHRSVAISRGGHGALWNLNSANNEPNNPSVNSFSSPPEGKLWNIVFNGRQFVFNQAHFKGSGTIVISSPNNEPVDVIFSGNVSCDEGTRLGILTRGNIIFRTPPDGHLAIGCGSYATIGGGGGGGGIFFEDAQFPTSVTSGEIKGIFVAKNNIVLPDPNNLLSLFLIRYDSTFAANPTTLFREILSILFREAS